MKIPERTKAERLLQEAETLNPGGWADHARYVALAAKNIAEVHPELDAETSYILGLLHDIGRREGITGMRHGLDGYRFLTELGFDGAARVCITHSFPIKDVALHAGKWDCSEEDVTFVERFLHNTEFSDHDKLLQLCDALALPSGICLLEKRIVDAALRHGVNPMTVKKWGAFLELQTYFERAIGRPIYSVLPGVVENTFGFTP